MTDVIHATPASIGNPARVSVAVPGPDSRRIYIATDRDWIDMAATSGSGEWEPSERDMRELAGRIRDAVRPILEHLRLTRSATISREHAIALGLLARQTASDWIGERFADPERED